MIAVATPAELLQKTRSVWSKIDAAPIEDMRNMRWAAGEAAAEAFTGVRPVDVDIDSSGFQSGTPLLELPGRAAAAYLGTYLISLLDGLDLEEKVGFPTDGSTRVHTLTVLTSSRFWSDIAGPYLSPECLGVVGEVADLLVEKREMLALRDNVVARLERLSRAVQRALGDQGA